MSPISGMIRDPRIGCYGIACGTKAFMPVMRPVLLAADRRRLSEPPEYHLDHRLDDFGVELGMLMTFEFVERLGREHGRTIGTATDHRVEAVGDRHDARRQRNLGLSWQP